MALSWLSMLLLWALVFSATVTSSTGDTNLRFDDLGVHVVLVGGNLSWKSASRAQLMSEHQGLLAAVLGSAEQAQEAILYHYYRTFRGFAAKLTPDQVQVLKGLEGVQTVFRSRLQVPTTTRTWKFLGVDIAPSHPFPNYKEQSDVIIGVLDTGYWPESKSFGDQDLGRPPARWKGECVAGQNFTAHLCNNKVIGARFYHKGVDTILLPPNQTHIPGEVYSARDMNGHGSHTASTAAGRRVSNVSFFGLEGGTARGGAPGARLAIYKVCWAGGVCEDSDILKGFDDAIADGVDIISLSLAVPTIVLNVSNLEQAIAIGALHAAFKGVLTSISGGNEGPAPFTVKNTAPWFLTVGASSIDRQLITDVILGNGRVLPGLWSVNVQDIPDSAPLVLSTDAASAGTAPEAARLCVRGTIDATKTEGRVVVCYIPAASDGSSDTWNDYISLVTVGDEAAGIIFIASPGSPKSVDQLMPLPATVITKENGDKLVDYIHSTRTPVVRLLRTKSVDGIKPAPIVASFSSRGPSPNTRDILKPDVIAPGISVLAAFSPQRHLGDYVMDSGTSMACPHVTGTAALIKAAHPNWSPSAIKSAIMTTAYVEDDTDKPIRAYPHLETADENTYGSGHINPASALDPGLVYETHPKDYLQSLCSYENATLLNGVFKALEESGFTDDISCPKEPIKPFNMNYPSIFVVDFGEVETVRRVVTNVGPDAKVEYTSRVCAPEGIDVTVHPRSLQFQDVGEELEFFIQLKRKEPTQKSSGLHSGSITWTDQIHSVRSPIVVATRC